MTYATELTGCDGSDSTIAANKQCVIAVADLIVAPFSLPWGTSVYAKVIATNVKGDSTESNSGNGAIIVTIPDPPVNLLENVPDRSYSRLGLKWEEAAFNGGTNVIDYRLWRAV